MEEERLRVKALAEAHLMEVEERKVCAEERRFAIENQVEMNKMKPKSAKSCSWMRAGWITIPKKKNWQLTCWQDLCSMVVVVVVVVVAMGSAWFMYMWWLLMNNVGCGGF